LYNHFEFFMPYDYKVLSLKSQCFLFYNPFGITYFCMRHYLVSSLSKRSSNEYLCSLEDCL